MNYRTLTDAASRFTRARTHRRHQTKKTYTLHDMQFFHKLFIRQSLRTIVSTLADAISKIRHRYVSIVR